MTEPTRRERTRPLELLGLSAGLALAIGIIAFLSTRDWLTAAIFFGVAFVVILVVFAMLLLAVTPRGGGDDEGPGVTTPGSPPAGRPVRCRSRA